MNNIIEKDIEKYSPIRTEARWITRVSGYTAKFIEGVLRKRRNESEEEEKRVL